MLHIFYSFVDGRAGGLSFWLHISGPSQSFGGIIEMVSMGSPRSCLWATTIIIYINIKHQYFRLWWMNVDYLDQSMYNPREFLL